MYLHEWKKHFEPDNFIVMDGESWNLEIKLTGNRVRRYHGDNAYPPYWKELQRLFQTYNPPKSEVVIICNQRSC